MKPNLFIPGAAKSGTSSLHQYLNLHPNIYMSKKKEPHFFAYDYKYFNESETYYKSFDEGHECKYRGESSTGYMVFANTIERIRKDIKSPKFIFVLRNPIDRIFSHYNWVDGIVGENLSFEKAVEKDFDIVPDHKKGYNWGYKNYFQFGLYGKWLEPFYKSFSKNDILIILTEDLKKKPLDTLNSCCSFLNISKFDEIPNISSNATVYYKNGTLMNNTVKFFNTPRLFSFFERYIPSVLFNPIKKLRHNAYLFFKRTQTINEPQRLTINQKLWLKKIYSNDVKKLKQLTNKDFNIWTEFENV